MYAPARSILLVNRVFPPDVGATGRRLADLAERLAAAGWRVTVLADGSGEGNSNGPGDPLPGVTVLRSGGAVPRRGPPDGRAYAGALARLLWRGLTLPRHDVIVTMTDPPLLAVVGPILALRHRAATVHWCHDLYPALLPLFGLHVPGVMMRLTEAAAALALRRCGLVVAIGRCMAERITALGVPRRRLAVLPNWADPAIRPVPRVENGLRTALGLGDGSCDGLVVAYSGNFGLAHPMGALLDAAEELERTAPAVTFLLIGEGRGHAAVARAAAARGLGNLRFLPFQPEERLAESLSCADLHLATLEAGAEGLMVPSKVMGALAAGRPCLFLGPSGSEAARLLTEGGCGRVLAPDDGAGLAAAIRHYAADPALLAEQGRRALDAASCWNADLAAGHFARLLDALPARRRPWVRHLACGEVPHA